MAVITLNGQTEPIDETDHRPLVEFLREDKGLTGTKLVCGSGVCGACTVLIDGKPVASCLQPCSQTAGSTVTTVEAIK